MDGGGCFSAEGLLMNRVWVVYDVAASVGIEGCIAAIRTCDTGRSNVGLNRSNVGSVLRRHPVGRRYRCCYSVTAGVIGRRIGGWTRDIATVGHSWRNDMDRSYGRVGRVERVAVWHGMRLGMEALLVITSASWSLRKQFCLQDNH